MSRRRHRPEWDEHIAGVKANFDGVCLRCDDPILVNQRVVRIRNGWVHIKCSSGWDE